MVALGSGNTPSSVFLSRALKFLLLIWSSQGFFYKYSIERAAPVSPGVLF